MNYSLINGAFEAKLPGLVKLTLLGMLRHRNDQTGRVWVSQETLAKELGISYNTVARAVDKLAELKVLVYIGEMPLNPGCVGRSTHIYEIDMKPLGLVPSQGRNGGLVTSEGTNGGDWSPLRVPNEIQSGVNGVGGGGGLAAKQSVGPTATHTHTYTHPNADSFDETPYGVKPDPNQQQPLRFSEEEIGTLVSLFTHLTKVEDSEATDSLRSYSGPFTSARLALLMYFAFRLSNLLSDITNTYTYNQFNQLASVNGTAIIYDAFGQMVQNGTTSIWYTPAGKSAAINGSSLAYTRIPTPGEGFDSHFGGADQFLHSDWLGNARIVSNVAASSVTMDTAFAPYGQQYDTFGTNGSGYDSFTGDYSLVIPGSFWDTPNRELTNVGRWLNPDPAGAGWNQYAYVTNPNSQIDPSGLECLVDCDDPSGWGGIGGGSGFGGIDGLSGNFCDPTDDPSCIFTPITPPGGLPGPVGGGGGPTGPGGAQPQPTGNVWPNNETLCLPTGLGSLFGSSGTQCGGDFSTFDPADLLSFTDCPCGECACPRLPDVSSIWTDIKVAVIGGIAAASVLLENRCSKVIQQCKESCKEQYADDRGGLPGTGPDFAGRIRQCIRQCAASQGCFNF